MVGRTGVQRDPARAVFSMMLSSWRLGMHRLRSPGTACNVGRVVPCRRRTALLRRPASRSPRPLDEHTAAANEVRERRDISGVLDRIVERLCEVDRAKQCKVGVIRLLVGTFI